MTSFAFNFAINEDDDSASGGVTVQAVGDCPVSTEQQQQQQRTIEEFTIDSDAFPVCEDGVVATVETLSGTAAGDMCVQYYCPEEVTLWARANCQAPYLAVGEGDDQESATVVVSDLVSGVYEGGFQVWECAEDLARWLMALAAGQVDGGSGERRRLLLLRPGLRVAEFGCGAGLPGLSCLRWLQPASFTFQDFNSEVLRAWTMANCRLNAPAPAPAPAQSTCRLSFIAGSWTAVAATASLRGAFDLVLTSETIYSPASYGQLHDALDHTLAPDGQALVAAKAGYFGVGGSVSLFREFVTARGVFEHAVAHQVEGAALARVVLLLWRKA